MIKERHREANFKWIQDARKRNKATLQVSLLNDPYLDITLAELQNEMAEELAKYEEPLEIVLFGNNKAEHKRKWKKYRENQSRLRNTEDRNSQ